MSWLRRLLNTFRPSGIERDIERELSFHLAERTDQLRSEGLSDAEAKRRARLQFGNPVVQAERTREVNLANWADSLLRNLRFSGEYFATLGIARLEGEPCRLSPDAQAMPEVMVNRSFADRYFRGRSVLGLRLSWEDATLTGRIVGVVADARELGLDREPGPTVYACDSAPTPFPWFLARTAGDPAALAGAVRLKLKELEPLRSVYDMAPLEQRIGDAYEQNRLRTMLLVLFAATALFLACLGLYGTLSYAVSLRRREVGLRLALGARRSAIVRQIVGQGLRVLGLACLCGLALAFASARVLSGMLYGVSPADPFTLAGVLAIVLGVGSLAALVPAARASQIEPMRVLREE